MIKAILAGLAAIPELIKLINGIDARIGQLERAFKHWRDEEFFRESRRLRDMADNAQTPEEKHEAARLASELLSRL